MNNPVKFELATLLKDKGYDLSCDSCYSEHDKIRVYNRDYIREGLIIFAPTIAEVVMWLYEKHGIWIRMNSMDGKLFFFDIWWFGKKPNTAFTNDAQIITDDSLEFNSPTEAYESGIEYVLKNIIK